MKRVIIILIVLFPIIGFGQSSLEKLFLNIPVELHFEELCNSLPKDTINYSINKYRKSLIKKSDYSINFHQCDGFNLTFKNINNITRINITD